MTGSTEREATQDPSRLLSRRYTVALLSVAGLTIAGTFFTQVQLAQRADDARTINKAGRQRMISQRLVRDLLYGVRPGMKEPIANDPRIIISDWKFAHRELQRDAEDPTLKRLYAQIEPDMNALTRVVIDRRSPNELSDREANEAFAISDRFLAGMEQIVERYTLIADRNLTNSRILNLALFALILIVLVVEFFVIFRPNVRLVSEAFTRTTDLLDKARAGERSRDLFIANISHEVRTPLNGILGLTRLALDDAHDPVVKERLALALQSGEGLLCLLNDVIDYARDESDRIVVRPEPTDVAEIAREIAALSRPLAAPGVGIEVEQGIEFPARLSIDPVRIRQVIGNLVSNGVKFTEEGRVLVRLDHANDELSLVVEDTGPGMTDDIRERLFTVFMHGDETARRRHGGAGLGLVIVKRTVETMGGTIDVSTSLGRGTRFTVTIPATVAEAKVAPKTDAPRDGDGLRVLVVEDDPINRQVVAAFLSRLGYAPTLAVDAREGLAQFAEESYDVVLMDWHLPEMDGIEATRQLRRMPRGAETPVIAFTASALPEDRRTLASAGMDGFLAKPVRPEDLDREIRRVRANISE